MKYQKSEWRKEKDKNFLEALAYFILAVVAVSYFSVHLLAYLIN